MVLSINTNSASMLGLQQLNGINSAQQTNQQAITTGRDVNGYKDNAAAFAIATAIRGDVAETGAAKSNINLAEAATTVGLRASELIGEQLIEMKALAIRAANGGLDSSSQQALQAQFSALSEQVNTIAQSASINGNNLVYGSGVGGGSGNQDILTLSTGNGNSTTITGTDLSAGTLGIDSLDVSVDAAGALSGIEAALATVGSQSASLGQASNSLSQQDNQLTEQLNTLTEGIGTIVDANLGSAAAQQNALQVQQQLATETLSIANSAPSIIQSLF